MSRPAHRQGTHRKGRAEQKAVSAYDLWMGGATYTEIAEQMECSVSTAHDRVHRGKAMLRGDVTDKRDRLGADLAEIMAEMKRQALRHEIPHPEEEGETMLVNGDVDAANSFKGLSERFSKLYGLDAPIKTDVTSDGQAVTVVFNQALTPKPQE